jgi:hypothetical protein
MVRPGHDLSQPQVNPSPWQMGRPWAAVALVLVERAGLAWSVLAIACNGRGL